MSCVWWEERNVFVGIRQINRRISNYRNQIIFNFKTLNWNTDFDSIVKSLVSFYSFCSYNSFTIANYIKICFGYSKRFIIFSAIWHNNCRIVNRELNTSINFAINTRHFEHQSKMVFASIRRKNNGIILNIVISIVLARNKFNFHVIVLAIFATSKTSQSTR